MPAGSFPLPEDRHYDAVQHLWVSREELGGRVRIGIDAIGLHGLGTLAYVALGEVGLEVARGEPLGSLEAAKMTASLLAPVSGVVAERNELVLSEPHRVGEDAYGDGWLVVLEPSRWAEESESLVAPESVREYHDAEVARLAAEDAGE